MMRIQSAASGALKSCVCVAVLMIGPALAAPPSPASFPISDKSFKCITAMTHVRHFYVDNLEVMVKREKGFNATTRDWEFFELNLSPDGSTIHTRGFQEVNNRFGGNCFTCHVKARAEFDLVCDNNHGCDPIPITRAMSGALQRTDPRCKNPPVSAEDAAALGQLAAIVKALAAASAPKPSP